MDKKEFENYLYFLKRIPESYMNFLEAKEASLTYGEKDLVMGELQKVSKEYVSSKIDLSKLKEIVLGFINAETDELIVVTELTENAEPIPSEELRAMNAYVVTAIDELETITLVKEFYDILSSARSFAAFKQADSKGSFVVVSTRGNHQPATLDIFDEYLSKKQRS